MSESKSQSRSARMLVNEERPFDAEELFFSTTDSRGVIRHGNDVFSRVAGIPPEGIFGKPHKIIRHPDMPRVVFKLFWDYLERGETIAAYVKNLARDGRYYWVMAVGMPCEGGYLSVRLKPTGELLPVVRELYKTLREIEAGIEEDPSQRVEAMEASAEKLNEALSGLGFDSYDAFMRHALRHEMEARAETMEKEREDCEVEQKEQERQEQTDADQAEVQEDLLIGTRVLAHSIDTRLQTMFDDLKAFRETGQKLKNTSGGVLKSAETVRVLGMNAAIAVNQMQGRGSTLRVVAESLGGVAGGIQNVIGGLSAELSSTVLSLDELMFELSATKLQSEMGIVFLNEMRGKKPDGRVAESLKILFNQMSQRVSRVFEHLENTNGQLVTLAKPLAELVRHNRTLRFVHFTGRKEAASIEGAEGFAVVLDKVPAQIEKTADRCGFINESVEAIHARVSAVLVRQESIGMDIAKMSDFKAVAA
ncbi:MAG: PAS domain-containing protein [Algisphaera sp.]